MSLGILPHAQKISRCVFKLFMTVLQWRNSITVAQEVTIATGLIKAEKCSY